MARVTDLATRDAHQLVIVGRHVTRDALKGLLFDVRRPGTAVRALGVPRDAGDQSAIRQQTAKT